MSKTLPEFPATADYRPPSEQELEHSMAYSRLPTKESMARRETEMDVRTAVRIYLRLRDVTGITAKLLTRPYDVGFNFKCDGKSHPLYWLRVPYFLQVLGFARDIGAVRHDFDYYQGGIPRKHADQRFRRHQVALGYPRIAAYLEYIAVRLFGWVGWRKHRKLERLDSRYGSIPYIRNLPDVGV